MTDFGVNKNREISRLVYEITKITGRAPALEADWNFEKTKKYLLAMRYPKTFGRVPLSSYYLPKLNVGAQTDIGAEGFSPKQIFVDKFALNSVPAVNSKKLFPDAQYTVLDGEKPTFAASYAKRTDILYIFNEKYDFIKPCPCTKGANCCGYNLVNLGFGCAFECEYCFLQEYQNFNAVALPANIDDFLARIDGAKLNKGPFERVRIGSGEFTDSLIFDHITEYSKKIVPFFKARPELMFEFKTKSVNIANLLELRGAENIVVAWSVNAENISAEFEHYTPPLGARLAAARQICAAGYRTAFHFDPVIIHPGWQENYEAVFAQIASAVPAEAVAWISVGTLRFSRGLKTTHESRWPHSQMLNEEFILGYDGKMRYSDGQRKEVYDFFLPRLQKLFPKTQIYLCMENAKI